MSSCLHQNQFEFDTLKSAHFGVGGCILRREYGSNWMKSKYYPRRGSVTISQREEHRL